MVAKQNPSKISLDELIKLSEAARSLNLARRRIRTRLAGQYLSPAKGRGMEFSESRPYQPGDDVRNIDWRVTARNGNTYTKLFQEERERPVLLCIDARLPMSFATQGRFKSVVAAELAAMLAWAAEHQGDRVGGELFWESGHREFRPTRGKRSLLHLLQELANFKPDKQVAKLQSMQPALQRMRQIAHAGSLLCVISDFRGFDHDAESQLVHIARHSEVLMIQVYDPLEMQLPEHGLFNISNGQKSSLFSGSDHKFTGQYAERALARHDYLEKFCQQQNIPLLRCASNQPGLPVLQQLYGKRRKRA